MNAKNTSLLMAARGEWKIWVDFETTSIENSAGQLWKIGQMYGNPQAGLITHNEKYAVVIGCGVMIADLNRFGEEIAESVNLSETPVVHILCQPSLPGVWPPPHEWHFEAVYEPDIAGTIRLVSDLDGIYGGIYELRLPDLTLRPLLIGSKDQNN